MRLIDADAIIKEIKERNPDDVSYEDAWAITCIEHAPTIDPQRKTGKWIHGREIAREMIGDCTTAIFYDGWTCSECGCLVEKEREPWYKYCPNCGAKMEGSK